MPQMCSVPGSGATYRGRQKLDSHEDQQGRAVHGENAALQQDNEINPSRLADKGRRRAVAPQNFELPHFADNGDTIWECSTREQHLLVRRHIDLGEYDDDKMLPHSDPYEQFKKASESDTLFRSISDASEDDQPTVDLSWSSSDIDTITEDGSDNDASPQPRLDYAHLREVHQILSASASRQESELEGAGENSSRPDPDPAAMFVENLLHTDYWSSESLKLFRMRRHKSRRRCGPSECLIS